MPDLARVRLASGIELAVWEEGPKDAPALIFLHGFPESHRTWRHQIPHFAKHYRCVAPDQRGYGASSKPAGVEAYAPAMLIGDVFQLADALGIECFTVLGHDWGGVIAWGVAMTASAEGPAQRRVTRAIIANAPYPGLFQRRLFLDSHQRAASQYIRAFRDPANDALVWAHGLVAMLVKGFAGRAIASLDDPLVARVLTPLAENPDELARLLTQWADPATAFAMLAWYRASPVVVPAMDAPFSPPEGWAAPPLPRITVPTLVLWGMEDTALPPANLDGLDAAVADLTLVPIGGCGHFSPWQAPDAVTAAIATFLG